MQGIPEDFGGSWDNFISEWCLGTEPPYSRPQTERGLSALGRHLPEVVRHSLANGRRGVLLASPLIDLGCILADCEGLDGFSTVLDRARGHERSARSELTVAATLARIGYRPAFGAPLEGKLLDLVITVNEKLVYVEVVAPNRSDATLESQRWASDLLERLRSRATRCRVEVGPIADLNETVCDQVDELVATIPEDAQWYQTPDIAVARKTPSGAELSPLFDGATAAVISVGGETQVQGDSSSVFMRWPSTDDRLKRIFDEEHHHFSRKSCNLLVIDTTAVPAGIVDWLPLVERRFQPTQNTRVGAVALYVRGPLSPTAQYDAHGRSARTRTRACAPRRNSSSEYGGPTSRATGEGSPSPTPPRRVALLGSN
jgi:hypothetical protein